MSAKVRIACRRCRTKRIKCDGGTPACGNCQKAGEPCIDVDGRNNSLLIPRDFATNARARIEWLEQRIRALSPDFILSEGPRVDFSFLNAVGGSSNQTATSPRPRDINQQNLAPSPETCHSLGKRTRTSISDPVGPDAFAYEARSVALDLGLLTLNSDSRQTHYLGTSSGRLFTRIIGAGSPDTTVSPGSDRSAALSSVHSSSKLGAYAHTKRLKESCRSLFDTLRKNLPAEDDALLLLDVYFRHIHVDHPFIHPDSLLSAVDALYQCAAADGTAEIGHKGWPDSVRPFAYNGEFERSRNIDCTPITVFTATFHVFMAFTLAATVRTRQRAYDFAPNQFYRVAMSADQHCFSHTSLASLQATLLLAVHNLLSPTELNIWTLTYVSMAHCVDLGLHRSMSNDCGLSAATILTRKLIFFSVYHLDRYVQTAHFFRKFNRLFTPKVRSIASIQGRPLGIRDETFDLQLPTLADIQADRTNIGDHSFLLPVTSVSGGAFTIHRFKLDPIISEIKLLFYHLPSQTSAYVWPSDENSSLVRIRRKLEEWLEALNDIDGPSNDDDEERLDQERHKLKLTSQFYAAMVLLHQPSQAIPRPSEQSILLCYEYAAKRLNTYHSLYQFNSYFQSWRSVQGIFSSGATMIYCLWSSGLVRRTIPTSVAMRDLRTCTNLLSVGGEFWPSVKKGKESFSRAMDALACKLEQLHLEQYQQYDSSDGPRQKLGRNNTARMYSSDQQIYDLTEGTTTEDQPHAIAQGQDDPTGFLPDTFALNNSDWSNLGINAIAYDDTAYSDAIFGGIEQAPDATVEAFITEFFNNQTAWNPF